MWETGGLETITHCWVDAGSPGFCVFDQSPDLASFFALESDDDYLFLEWVAGPHACEMWAAICGDSMHHRSRTRNAMSGLQIVLRSPSPLASLLEVHAHSQVDADESCVVKGVVFEMSLTPEQEESDNLTLLVTLHHIKTQQLLQAIVDSSTLRHSL